MKMRLLLAAAALLTFGHAPSALADDDFRGIVHFRPAATVGTWIVGGIPVHVTWKTELEYDHGPLLIGTCAKVEMDGRRVEKIESKPIRRCYR